MEPMQTYEKVKEEIEVMKSNQAQNTKDYGIKISKLDKEVTELTEQKKKLSNEVNDLSKGKDSITNDLRIEAKRLHEEAKAVLVDAKNTLKALKERTEDLLKRISEEEQRLAGEGLKVADRESKVKAEEVNINKLKRDTEINFKEVEDALFDAREYSKGMEEDKRKVANMKEKLEVSMLIAEEKQNKLDEKNKVVNNLNSKLKDIIQKNKDLLAKNERDQEELRKDREHHSVIEKEAKANYEGKLDNIIDQAEANNLRSIELDAGFSKLREESSALSRESKKLEEIKKQLSK